MEALDQSGARELARIGRYRVVRRLPSSSWADVYLVRRDGASNTLLVKRILPALLSSAATLESFRAEINRTAQLSHQNLARLFEAWEDGGAQYVAQELAAGHSFRDIGMALRSVRMAFDPTILARLTADALRGLHYAHELRNEAGTYLRFVHGDITPDNVVVGKGALVKVTDFALARSLGTTTDLSQTYTAPELTRGAPLDRRADIYSVGVVLNGLLGSLFANRPSGVPKDLEQIVRIAIAKDPAARYQDAQEMADALQAFATRNADSPSPAEVDGLLAELFTRKAAAASLDAPALPGVVSTQTKLRVPPPPPPPNEQTEVESAVVPPPFNWRGPALSGAIAGFIALLGVLWAIRSPSEPKAVTELGPPTAVEPREEPTQAAVDPLPMPPPPAGFAPVEDEPESTPVLSDEAVGDEAIAEAKQETQPEVVVRRPVRTGRVEVRAHPWAEVLVGGELRGTTPLETLILPSGRQTLILRNTKLGVEKRVAVLVPAGGKVVVNETLTRSR